MEIEQLKMKLEPEVKQLIEKKRQVELLISELITIKEQLEQEVSDRQYLRTQAQLGSPLVNSSPLTPTVHKISNETKARILFQGAEDTDRESFTVVGMCGKHIQLP